MQHQDCCAFARLHHAPRVQAQSQPDGTALRPCSGLQGALKGLHGLLLSVRLCPMHVDTPVLAHILMQQVSRHITLTTLQPGRSMSGLALIAVPQL